MGLREGRARTTSPYHPDPIGDVRLRTARRRSSYVADSRSGLKFTSRAIRESPAGYSELQNCLGTIKLIALCVGSLESTSGREPRARVRFRRLATISDRFVREELPVSVFSYQ